MLGVGRRVQAASSGTLGAAMGGVVEAFPSPQSGRPVRCGGCPRAQVCSRGGGSVPISQMCCGAPRKNLTFCSGVSSSSQERWGAPGNPILSPAAPGPKVGVGRVWPASSAVPVMQAKPCIYCRQLSSPGPGGQPGLWKIPALVFFLERGAPCPSAF